MTTYLEDEASAEDSQPVEVYYISTPTQTFHLASGNRDFTFDAQVFTALSMARTEIALSQAGKPTDLILTLPVNHELVTRFLLQGIPQRYIDVTVYRYQIRSAGFQQIWKGRVTSLAVEGRVAKFRIPSRSGEMMQRSLPQITRGRLCPHILYDARCQVARASFKVSTTAIYVTGRVVRVDLGSVAKNAPWAVGGELVHVLSGERMTIQDQVDMNPGISAVSELTMQLQIPGMATGDSVEIYAGCDHTIATCNSKFSNQRNFGGFPQINTRGAINLVWHIKDQED